MNKFSLSKTAGLGKHLIPTNEEQSSLKQIPQTKVLLPVDSIEMIFQNINKNKKIFNENQVNRLLALSNNKGKVLNINNRELMYEIISFCISSPDMDAYISFLENQTIESNKDIIFNDKSFEKEHKNYVNDSNNMRRDVTIRIGVKCPSCKSTNTSSVMAQLRSGDEGMNTITKCFNCGKTFKN